MKTFKSSEYNYGLASSEKDKKKGAPMVQRFITKQAEHTIMLKAVTHHPNLYFGHADSKTHNWF